MKIKAPTGVSNHFWRFTSSRSMQLGEWYRYVLCLNILCKNVFLFLILASWEVGVTQG